MKITSKLEKSTYNMHRIPINLEDGHTILEKFGKRFICTVNKGISIHCALMNSKDTGFYIMIGKSTKVKIKVKLGEQLNLHIKKDSTKHQAVVSIELKEVLATDQEGQLFFNKLTPGKQRSLIHYVNKAKQSDTRIDRALRIVENLKLGITDLKLLLKVN